MKKRVLSIMLAASLVLSMGLLSACGSEKENTSGETAKEETEETEETGDGDLLQTIQERGTIVVATEGTWAPWTYHDEDDNLVGFDVEVAQAIAEKLGVKVEFAEVEWDGILAGVDSGRYDMAANGVDVDEERQEKYSFTTPYCYNHTAIIVKNENDEIKSFEDLDGKQTANTLSSTYAALAEQYGAEVTGVDDLAQTIELLLAGRIDATLNAEVSYYDYVKQHPEADIKIAALTEDSTSVAFPVRKDSSTESFVKAVNEALEELKADGTLSQLAIKYFGSDITKE